MPQDRNLYNLTDALQTLTDQVRRNNDYLDLIVKREQDDVKYLRGSEVQPMFPVYQPGVGRSHPDQLTKYGSWTGRRITSPATAQRRAEEREWGDEAERPLFETEAEQPYEPPPVEDINRANEEHHQAQQSDWSRFNEERSNLRQQGASRTQAALGALGRFRKGGPDDPAIRRQLADQTPQKADNLPSDNVDTGARSGAPHTKLGSALHLHDQDEQAMSWAILGEHGGPSFIRNPYLESYGLQRSIDWAQNAAQSPALTQMMTKLPGVSADSAEGLQQGISGALNVAGEHPVYTYAAYKAAQTLGGVKPHLDSMREAGYALGYGPPAGGPGIAGHPNLLPGQAMLQGAELTAEEKILQLPGAVNLPGAKGQNLTSQQARDVMTAITQSGWGMDNTKLGIPTGPAAQLAQGVFGPLSQQVPGVSAQNLNELIDPAVRNAGTSLDQLRRTLGNLGDEAQSAHENVNVFAASVANASQTFESMGASSAGARGTATSFTDATGLDPQIGAQLAQNPLVQGMTLARTGVLPSGQADMGGGMLAQNSLATVQMLQRAFSGFKDKTEMINGHRVMIESGQQQQADQISHMTGIKSADVTRMLQMGPQYEARGELMKRIGDPGAYGGGGGLQHILNQMGGGKHLNSQQYTQAQSYWQDVVHPQLKAAGLTQQQVSHLEHTKNFPQRIHDLRADLNQNERKKDPMNQIQNDPNNFKITLTPDAHRLLKWTSGGATVQKRISGAGGQPYASTVNSPTGDLTNATSSGWTPDASGNMVTP